MTRTPWYHRGAGPGPFPFGYYLHITAGESVDYLKAELQQMKVELQAKDKALREATEYATSLVEFYNLQPEADGLRPFLAQEDKE